MPTTHEALMLDLDKLRDTAMAIKAERDALRKARRELIAALDSMIDAAESTYVGADMNVAIRRACIAIKVAEAVDD